MIGGLRRSARRALLLLDLERPPLAYLNVDVKTLADVLERLCNDGLVVRWYEVAEAPGRERQAVYRRVSSG